MVKEYISNLKRISKNARLFLIGGIFNGFGFAVFRLLFNLYMKEYGFSESEIGNVLSFGSLGATIIAVPTAFLIERVHIKKLLVWSTIAAGLSYWFQVYFKDLNFIMSFSFLATMFITVFRISAAPFFMRNTSAKERIYVFSLNSAIMMFSAFLGSLIGGNLPNLYMFLNISSNLLSAYEISLYTSVVISIFSLFPFIKITQKRIPVEKLSIFAKLKSYNWKLIIKLMIPKILVGLGAGLVIPFMNLYFKIEYDLNAGVIGIYFSMLQIAVFLGMMFAPVLIKRFNMVMSIVFTELLSIPFMFILALTRNINLAVIAFVVRGMLMNMNHPISKNFEMELVKEKEQAFTNAVSMIAWNGTWTVSAKFGGMIIENYSFQYSFYITIGLYFLSAASYYLFFRKMDKRYE